MIMLPPKLYKYRTLNSETLEMLKKGKIIASLPTGFNDPYDCHRFIEPRKLLNNSLARDVFNMYKQSLMDFIKRDIGDIEFLDWLVYHKKKTTPNKYWLYNPLKANDIILSKINDNCLYKEVSSYLEDFMFTEQERADIYKGTFMRANKGLKEDFYIYCLSEKYDEILMWSHYADNHKGFCIEYDFKPNLLFFLLPNCNIGFDFLQKQRRQFMRCDYVRYVSDLTNSTEIVERYFFAQENMVANQNSNESKKHFYKCLEEYIRINCEKYEKWQYEKEWRVFIVKEPDRDSNRKFIILNAPKINAIYLGANIDKNSSYYIELINWIKDNNIELRQMKMKYNKYELYYEVLSI